MDRKEITKKHQQITRYIEKGQLGFAIDLIKVLLRQNSRSDFHYTLEAQEENYKNLLRYTWEGYEDPQRQTILQSIAASLLTLTDELINYLLEETYPFKHQSLIRIQDGFGSDSAKIAVRIDELVFNREISEILPEGKSSKPVFSDALFTLIWLSPYLKEHETKLLRFINSEPTVPVYEKCLAVSALTLSLLNLFDPKKFILLSEFIQQKEDQVYHRALTGLLLGLIRYDDRLPLFPELNSLVEDLGKEEDLRKDAEVIVLQLLMARETERITREFREDVLPDMQKMMPKISDKLKLDEVVDIPEEEEENPGWKEMIDEVPGLFEKIERFSKMQMEGADVFMGTFSMLKRFDFFNQISHWFVPFYHDHPALDQGSPADQEMRTRLMEGLEKAFYICNSDKYSFALNFQAIPAAQRSMIVTHFEAELEQMKEMASEEKKTDPVMLSNAIFTQYIQDLYRFYKLFPHKQDFEDVFLPNTDYTACAFFPKFFDPREFGEQLAAFYFSKDHWEEAIKTYHFLESKGVSYSQLYQKLGYAYQKTKQWAKALEAYQRAELFDTDKQWILKKLAWCSMKLGDYSGALEAINQALKEEPKNLNLHSQAGQCYLNLGQYEEAIRHYTQVRFFSPGNLKALRPIAYAQFVSGHLEEAEEAYREILDTTETPGPYDLMNAGHVALSLGHKEDALKRYREALSANEMNKHSFEKIFSEDIPYLIKHGIREEELPLMLEFILSQ
jgi:tetratricopeptide (TPR) repeat protein